MNQDFLHICSPIHAEFETAYLKVRRLEQRVYSDEEVRRLPKSKKQENEWKLRSKSAFRFVKYLKEKHQNSKLLEIGCGNGWFTNYCSNHVSTATGVDINSTELKQAVRLFGSERVQFYLWDLFEKSPFEHLFDVIVLNASVQYFENFDALIERLKRLLNSQGEIHIIDSPFYDASDIPSAKRRTKDYYASKGVDIMAEQYYHHSIQNIVDFDELYKGRTSKLNKLIFGKDSPFSWYRYSLGD